MHVSIATHAVWLPKATAIAWTCFKFTRNKRDTYNHWLNCFSVLRRRLRTSQKVSDHEGQLIFQLNSALYAQTLSAFWEAPSRCLPTPPKLPSFWRLSCYVIRTSRTWNGHPSVRMIPSVVVELELNRIIAHLHKANRQSLRSARQLINHYTNEMNAFQWHRTLPNANSRSHFVTWPFVTIWRVSIL
jgi:hypothetical protein